MITERLSKAMRVNEYSPLSDNLGRTVGLSREERWVEHGTTAMRRGRSIIPDVSIGLFHVWYAGDKPHRNNAEIGRHPPCPQHKFVNT